MGRSLKFRAWSNEHNRYCDFVTLDEQGRWVGWTKTSGVFLTTLDIIVEQYTGLKDKNGKEIYEGDIVRWVDDYDENAYINFDEGCFWVNWPINSERINGDMVDDLEVIGNIHENPELLGGEE